MRLRYTLEILTVALLMAAGSIMRPAAPAPGCHLLTSAWSTVVSMGGPAHPMGGRG